MGKKFVLQNDFFAKRIIENLIDTGKPLTLRANAFNKEVQLLKGSMLEELNSEKPHTPGMLNLKCLDNDSVKVICPENVLHEVSLFQAEILIAVSPVQDRLLVLEDKSWIREAAMIMVGSNVYVDVGENKPPTLGLVKYCGPVPEIGKGIMFGIELTEQPELGDSDGSIRSHHYFSTRTSMAGMFLAINKLRLLQERKSFNPCSITVRAGSVFENKIGLSASESPVSSPVQSSKIQPIPFEKAVSDGDTPPPLRLNDKVVWISDTGPEYGVVKWLGKLPDVGKDWMVGLEFVNPVGSGTGKYNDYQLFEAKQNHASLVPIIGLMKAEDFLGDKPPTNGSTSSTPPRPNRKKRSSDYTDTISHTGKSSVQLSQTFSSLPRDLQKKSEYSSPTNASLASLIGNNSSPHGTMQKRSMIAAPSGNLQMASHTRSHSASLMGSGFESPSITSLYSTVDKDRKNNSSQWDKVSNYSDCNHYPKSGSPSPSLADRSRENDMVVLNGSKSGGNSPALHRLNLALSEPDSLGKSDAGLPSLTSTNSQSYYHVTHDDCLPRVSSSNSNPINPLYEISNRKGNSLRLGGTTRLDDTINGGHKTVGTISHQTLPAKKTHTVVSNGTSHVTSNNINNNSNNQIISNSTDLEVGSVVEVMVNGEPCYGVIRWIGLIPEDQNSNKYVAGIEMEEENPGSTDGTFHGRRYFQCQPRKAFFVRLSQCRKDGRFLESEKRKSAAFGSIDCPLVSGDVPPICNPDKMRQLCGKNRGIQGHHNSCYLDATLFAMFSCTGVFDSLLHRPARVNDIPEYGEVQRVLKEEIVNPLRANMYVRADRVMRLRTLLDKLSSVSGLMSEEKDPEEFLNSLLNQILKADPFLKLSSGQEAYFYQLFVEKDEKLILPTVQQLFDQSFLASDIKLSEIPNCLLVQMPRFGKQFKMYPRIIPSLYLDITDVLDDSPRQCSVCGQVAEFECKECFGQLGTGLDSTAFCSPCMEKSHSHKKRLKHKCQALSVPSEFKMLKDHVVTIPRVYMELFAILCIETSHYVCFVKCGSGPDAPWCFFDSMADRKGEQNGYNIPEVVPFQDLRWWLSDEGTEFLMSTKDDKVLPEIARRLLCDAYMCLYQSPDVLMYR